MFPRYMICVLLGLLAHGGGRVHGSKGPKHEKRTKRQWSARGQLSPLMDNLSFEQVRDAVSFLRKHQLLVPGRLETLANLDTSALFGDPLGTSGRLLLFVAKGEVILDVRLRGTMVDAVFLAETGGPGDGEARWSKNLLETAEPSSGAIISGQPDAHKSQDERAHAEAGNLMLWEATRAGKLSPALMDRLWHRLPWGRGRKVPLGHGRRSALLTFLGSQPEWQSIVEVLLALDAGASVADVRHRLGSKGKTPVVVTYAKKLYRHLLREPPEAWSPDHIDALIAQHAMATWPEEGELSLDN